MDYAAHKEAINRANEARAAIKNCHLCPRNCGVDRTNGEKGYCRTDESIRCFKELFFPEKEQELNPSYQLHFTGCNLNCSFCASAEWNSEPLEAEKSDIDDLACKITQRQTEGMKTLNLLGGEPSVNIVGLLELLGKIDSKTLVIWNSNMYYSKPVSELLAGLIDIYLADFKCFDYKCATELLDASNYVQVVRQNLLEASKKSDLIIRHLILPGHYNCCLKPMLQWIAKEIPEIKLSLRGNYVPPAQKTLSPAGYLKPEEMQKAIDLANELELNLIT